MDSIRDTANKYVGIKEQRMILFAGLYLIFGLFTYAYIFEIAFFFTLLILAWYAHDFIDDYAKETIDPAGRYVFITGCDSGFGLASAKAIRELGFQVIAGCYDENSEGAQELKARSWVDKIEIVNLDVTSDIGVEAAAKEVREICQDQGLWGLINNAGLNSMGASELISNVTYHRIAEVNLFGAIRVTKAFLPLLRQTKGRVVNVTSERGFNPWKNSTAYCVTKFGLEAYSACLRQEMADFDVKVVTVAPGHFAGATSIADTRLNDVIREQLLVEYSRMSIEDQRNAYTKESIDKFFEKLDEAQTFHFTNKSVRPVVDAYVDAIVNKRPKYCYLVHGSGRFGIDPLVVMSRIRPFIPLSVVSYVESVVFTLLH